MTPTLQIIIDGATNIIDLKKLRNKIAVKGSPEEYPEDAVVTLIAVKKSADNSVIAGTEDLNMTHVEGTTGKKTTYRATLNDDINWTVGEKVYGDVLAEVAGGVRPFKIPCVVKEG